MFGFRKRKMTLFFVILPLLLSSIFSTPYVRIMEVEPWFNNIDTNNDKQLDRNELLENLRIHHDKHITRINSFHRFMFLNVAPKPLALEDFINLRQKRHFHSSKPEHKELETEVFKRADLNHDGLLDENEYAKLLAGLGDRDLREKIAHLEFGKSDKNNDGKLTYPEVIDHFKPKSDFHEEIMATIFEAVDKNGDDHLDKEELRKFHDELLDNHIEHDVDAFLHEVDDNENGKISLSEAKKHTDNISKLWNRSPDDEEIYDFRRDVNEL